MSFYEVCHLHIEVYITSIIDTGIFIYNGSEAESEGDYIYIICIYMITR